MLLAEQKVVFAWLFDVKQTLSYSQRLHQREDFESAIKSRPIIEKWLALHLQPNNHHMARLGIVISKRIVPKAISRNGLKRLIREEFRIQNCQKSINLVFRLRSKVLKEEKVEFRRTLSSIIAKARMREV